MTDHRLAQEIPARGAFESFVRVRFHEVDALGHVNNAAYLNYLEQAAIDHATSLGLDLARLRQLGGVFVARRHDITFVQPAYAGDLLRIVTWLGRPGGARVERFYRVFRDDDLLEHFPVAGRRRPDDAEGSGTLIVRATTEWVFADEAGLPRRIPTEINALFHPGEPA